MNKPKFRIMIDDKENPIPYVEREELQKKLGDRYAEFFFWLIDNEIEVDRFGVGVSDVNRYVDLLEMTE